MFVWKRPKNIKEGTAILAKKWACLWGYFWKVLATYYLSKDVFSLQQNSDHSQEALACSNFFSVLEMFFRNIEMSGVESKILKWCLTINLLQQYAI